MEERPWDGYGKPPRPLDPNRLRSLLKPFRVFSVRRMERGREQRGYERANSPGHVGAVPASQVSPR